MLAILKHFLCARSDVLHPTMSHAFCTAFELQQNGAGFLSDIGLPVLCIFQVVVS
jgi:hypothetical protein